MKLLFIHQNYPGQFAHLAPELARQGHDVRALTLRFKQAQMINGVKVYPYSIGIKPGSGMHPWVQDWEAKVLRGMCCAEAAEQMGWEPDVIIGHYGWGETLFLKHVFPKARLGLYCELYYDPDHPAVSADMQTMTDRQQRRHRWKMRLRNVNTRLHEDIMDAGLSPTPFQASSFPPDMRQRITVQHDGIDTDQSCPDPDVQFDLPDGTTLTRNDEVITYVARSLEPMRGFDVFMQALPDLLRDRPNAQIIVVGREGVSYGGAAPNGQSWKTHFMDQIAERLVDGDLNRVHFLGNIPHPQFRKMLQLSRVHIYLTRPFIVSWSLLEAMSTGCAIVASDGPSVRDVADEHTARLISLDAQSLCRAVGDLCDDADTRAKLGQAARSHVKRHYDLRQKCLPELVTWVERLAQMEPRPPRD